MLLRIRFTFNEYSLTVCGKKYFMWQKMVCVAGSIVCGRKYVCGRKCVWQEVLLVADNVV